MDSFRMNRQFGTKWFTFYSKVRPFLGLLSVFTVVKDFITNTGTYLTYWWLLLYFIAIITQGTLGIFVMIKSFGNYSTFVNIVKNVLIFETVSIPYNLSVKQYIQSGFEIYSTAIGFLIYLTLSYFLWYRLNIKYFEKRLIVNSNTIEETDIYNSDFEMQDEKIVFCRKCGERLIENSQFCAKCGTQIVELDDITLDENDNSIFCKKCGANITDDTDVCHVCGEKKQDF